MLARYGIAGVIAGFVTVGLFVLMQSLIALGEMALEDDGPTKIIDFVRLKRDSAVEAKKRELPRRSRPKATPTPPKMSLSAGNPRAGMAVNLSVPQPSTSMSLVGGPHLGGAFSDTEEVPLVRVQPMYPPRAAEEGIEGWVVTSFTITETGTVTDATVVEAQPRGVFDRSALRAIMKWKYRPKVVDGKPVRRTSIRVRLNFDLDG